MVLAGFCIAMLVCGIVADQTARALERADRKAHRMTLQETQARADHPSRNRVRGRTRDQYLADVRATQPGGCWRWICDYCDARSFATFYDLTETRAALAEHERTQCPAKP
jgi:hypothetical protein